MGAGRYHVEKARHAVQWIPHDQNALLTVKHGMTNPLRKVRLNNQHTLIKYGLPLETHFKKLFIKVSFAVAIGTRVNAGHLLQIFSNESVARSWI